MQLRTSEHQLAKCVRHVHIKYQMLPRGSDLVMIIGSKLQNKCTEFKNRTFPASLVDVMTLLHTPQAQCDIHTNQTQSATKTLTPSCFLFPISAIHPLAFLFFAIPRFLKGLLSFVQESGLCPHVEEIINKNMDTRIKYVCTKIYFQTLANC